MGNDRTNGQLLTDKNVSRDWRGDLGVWAPAVKVLHSICQQIWKTQQWPQDWKRSVFIPIPKKGNAKECSNYCTIALISHASRVILKILQARLQQYVNCELSHVQARFIKGRGTRDQIANIHWIIEKARVPETSTSGSFSSVQFSCSVVSSSFRPHGAQCPMSSSNCCLLTCRRSSFLRRQVR